MTTSLIVALSLQIFAQAAPAAPAPQPVAAPPKPPEVFERCGKARPNLDGIKTAEGLVIAPDGTIYFTQPFGTAASKFLGRYKPPYTELEASWADLGGKALGITIDPKRSILYAGSRDRKKLLSVTLSTNPVVEELADVEPTINGVTLGEDGAIYYTDQGSGQVYRVTTSGVKTQVTKTPVPDANGIAFGPDGRLYVLTYKKATVTRLLLKAGKESSREIVAELAGSGGKDADGITFDKQGRLYVTAGALYRITPDGKKVESLGEAYGANADFGSGALSCSDLYTAGNGKGIRRVETDAEGLDVPWHRPKLRLAEKVSPPSPPKAVPAKVAAKAKLEVVTSTAAEPVGIVAAPGEPVGRLFVIERKGPVRVLRGKTFDPKPFLDITGQVSLWKKPNSEQGLLGLAFHPQFQKNGRLFIHYSDLKWRMRVVELRVDKADPNRVDPASAKDLLTMEHPYDNHNGGNLEFGPDGKLYILVGDGGKAGDPHELARDPRSMLGKMMRMDVDASTPKVEVLGKGLRNPWRYNFDRKTGDLYIADVGQNLFEYVHVVPAKKVAGPHDFGWNVVEGNHCFQAKTCDRKGFVRPVLEYPHSEGCSITGGYVYRGKAIPELAGSYFYSDFCTAILRSFRLKGGKATDSWDWKNALDPDGKMAQITAFGEDQDGELYITSQDGNIFKLVPSEKLSSLTPGK